jgi:2-alkyl-3-oxoalkanoate reductase
MQPAKPQTILVTGGTGFTGYYLVRRLLEDGHVVRVVDNQKGFFYDDLIQRGAQVHIDSVTNRDAMFRVVEGCNVVHHLAAAFRGVNLPKAVYWDVNVNGTRHMLDAAEKHGVAKFIYCSTCGVHGDVKNPPAAETAPITPADYYQYTKWEGERVAHEFIQKGMDVTILRPAAIYGPGDPERWTMLFQRSKNGRFLMFGDGQATYHPAYIDNLIDGFVLAQERPESKGQTYLLADEHYYTLNDIVKAVGRVMGKEVRITYLPFAPLWVAAVITEGVYAPLKASPPIFRRRVDWFRQNRAFDISKARRELGYAPKVDLHTGLTRTYEWIIARNML